MDVMTPNVGSRRRWSQRFQLTNILEVDED